MHSSLHVQWILGSREIYINKKRKKIYFEIFSFKFAFYLHARENKYNFRVA